MRGIACPCVLRLRSGQIRRCELQNRHHWFLHIGRNCHRHHRQLPARPASALPSLQSPHLKCVLVSIQDRWDNIADLPHADPRHEREEAPGWIRGSVRHAARGPGCIVASARGRAPATETDGDERLKPNLAGARQDCAGSDLTDDTDRDGSGDGDGCGQCLLCQYESAATGLVIAGDNMRAWDWRLVVLAASGIETIGGRRGEAESGIISYGTV